MKTYAKILLPIGIVAIAGGISALLMATRKKPEMQPTPTKPTLVQTMVAQSQDQTFRVFTQGTVEPLQETILIPEVAGRITSVAPGFQQGGFFEAGDVMIEIDPSNHQAAAAQAEFNLAQAKLRLEQEKARAEQARKEWYRLSSGEPPPLAVRIPQLEAEQASVAWSEQALIRAKLDLERTTIRAPYACMVREKTVDVGQYVSPGNRLGVIFAIDFAEIRLPLSSPELAYLDLPYSYRGNRTVPPTPVKLSTRIAGRTHHWDAEIVRTEGTVDPSSRMLYAIARVANPYGRDEDYSRPPLQIGQFVEAEIRGHMVQDVFILPRQVLRGADSVLVVDEETRELRTRVVEVLKTDPATVIIGGGLRDGDLICITALEFVVEGMKVEIYSDSPTGRVGDDAGQLADTKQPAKEGGAL